MIGFVQINEKCYKFKKRFFCRVRVPVKTSYDSLRIFFPSMVVGIEQSMKCRDGLPARTRRESQISGQNLLHKEDSPHETGERKEMIL